MILVTGATGHIGNVLVRKLLGAGRRVRALVWRGEDTLPLQGLDVELVDGDLLEPESLKVAFDGVTEVFHLAGLISILPGSDRLLQRVNVEGTRNVISAAQRADVDRFVYTSSIHALEDRPVGVVIDESVPFSLGGSSDGYGRTKAEASLAVQKAVRAGLPAVIACPTGVVGPYDFRHSEIGSVLMDAALGKPMAFVEGAYDFADVRDVADGLMLAAERGRVGESYILSGGRISVRYMLATVREVTGRAFTCIKIPFKVARFAARFMPFYYRWTRARPRFTRLSLEVLRSNSNISHLKATRELGYQPRSFYNSIADTVGWLLENRRLRLDPRSS
jgi:dihydroflavonol-4-reductase